MINVIKPNHKYDCVTIVEILKYNTQVFKLLKANDIKLVLFTVSLRFFTVR